MHTTSCASVVNTTVSKAIVPSWSIAQGLRNGVSSGFPGRIGDPTKANGLCGERKSTANRRSFPNRKTERCSRRSDDGASRASGCPSDTENRAVAQTHLLEYCTKRNDLVLANEVQEIRAGVNFPCPSPIVRQRRAKFLKDIEAFQKRCWFCRWGSIMPRKSAKGV